MHSLSMKIGVESIVIGLTFFKVCKISWRPILVSTLGVNRRWLSFQQDSIGIENEIII